LSRKACTELARDALSRCGRRIAHVRADGNALYLEELIERSRRGRRRNAGDGAGHGGLGSKLEPEARRVLRAAASGETFAGRRAALLGSRHTAADGDWLSELCTRELVTRQPSTKLPGREQYAFRHSLLREAAYRMLTPEDRALGHRLAAEWLTDIGESNALLLAEHWDKVARPTALSSATAAQPSRRWPGTTSSG
jgi:hypothetical protein